MKLKSYIPDNRLMLILIGILTLLAIPLIAMFLTDQVVWTAFDFLIASVLLICFGIVIELSYRAIISPKTRTIILILSTLAFILIWIELAVGVFGTFLSGN